MKQKLVRRWCWQAGAAVPVSMVLFEGPWSSGPTSTLKVPTRVGEEHAATVAAADLLSVAGTPLSMFPATICCIWSSNGQANVLN